MSTIILFGVAPLPFEKMQMNAHSLRTWRFIDVLLKQNHKVIAVCERGQIAYPEAVPDVVEYIKNNLTYITVSLDIWNYSLGKIVSRYISDCQCAIATSTHSAAIAVQHIGNLPFWADLNGSLMAEAQTQAAVLGDDSLIAQCWQTEYAVIRRADCLSCVSERQKWAVIGELGAVGRLNKASVGYEFVHVIPVTLENTAMTPIGKSIRGILAQDDDFVLLNTGGFNTWTDVDTLFEALESIMRRRHNVIFVATGGGIKGYNELTFQRFVYLTKQSEFSNHYHLLNWVPAEDLPNYLLESNAAVNTDLMTYEALLGSRNRVLDWLKAGLPCIVTPLTELGQSIIAAGAGVAYLPENSQSLAEAIESLICSPAMAQEMGRQAKQLFQTMYTDEQSLQPMAQWVQLPKRAPDFAGAIAMKQTGKAAVKPFYYALALALWKPVKRLALLMGMRHAPAQFAEFGKNVLKMNRLPFAVDFNNSKIPLEMISGKQYDCEIELKNIGSQTWIFSNDAAENYYVRCAWLQDDLPLSGERMASLAGQNTMLMENIRAGKKIKTHIVVAAPETTGVYRLSFDIVRKKIPFQSYSQMLYQFTVTIKKEF